MDDQIDTELFFLAFAQDLNELRKKYHVVPIQLSDERGKNGVSIKPFKENEEDAQFEEIVLYLRDENFLPYRLRIVNKDDVQTIVDFEKMEINGKISLEDTQIYLPSGTNVYRERCAERNCLWGRKKDTRTCPIRPKIYRCRIIKKHRRYRQIRREK